MTDTWPFAMGEVGCEKKGAFGSFERVLLVLTLWKVAEENGLVLGVNIVVWGLRWRSPGSQMANTWLPATGEAG